MKRSRRTRAIAPGFFSNELLGECSPLARLLFAGLWCWADREGRVEDRPRRLRAEILPYDDADGEALVVELAARGFVIRYEAEGVRVIQIANFAAYQDPHPKESASELPARSGSDRSVVGPRVAQGSALGAPKADPWDAEVGSLPSRPSRPSSSLDLGAAPSAPPGRREEGGEGEAPASTPPPKARVARPADPRHAEWVAALVEAYKATRGEAYPFTPRDGKALQELLAALPGASAADAVARWRHALGLGARWPGCATISHLCQRWAELAPPARRSVGDLGVDRLEWWRHLSAEERAAFVEERARLDPDLDAGAPLAAEGPAGRAEVRALIEQTRARVAARLEGAAA